MLPPRTALSALESADGLRAVAMARPAMKIRSQSEHAVTHSVSELGCGLTEAVLVDTPCQAAWMAEMTHPCLPCSTLLHDQQKEACAVATMSTLDSHASGS